jgi:hypothetical protein
MRYKTRAILISLAGTVYLYKPIPDCRLTPPIALVKLLLGHFALAIRPGSAIVNGLQFAAKGGPNPSFSFA